METPDPNSPTPNPSPEHSPTPSPSPEVKPPANAPPAAEIVVNATKTEREAALERDVKEREKRIAELEDEKHLLKQAQQPKPQPKKSHWLEGGTFFD